MKTFLTGAHGVEEAIKRGRGILYVSRKGGRAATLAELAAEKGVPVRRVNDTDIDRLAPGVEHRGFALETAEEIPQSRVNSVESLIPTLKTDALVIILDGVTDPRNLGAVLRSADQFAADAVIIPKRRSATGDADVMSRASSGAIEWVQLIEVTNITRAMEELKESGFWLWGADIAGRNVCEANLKGRSALILGREGEGIHRLVKETCDGLVKIPTAGRLDSLNVATAAGILMYEVRRQQDFPQISS